MTTDEQHTEQHAQEQAQEQAREQSPGHPPAGAYRFDATTAVRPSGVPGTWLAEVDPRMSIGGRTNGGYLLALATRAALSEVEADGGAHQDPVAVSGAFVAVAPAGPVAVDVNVLRRGRGTSVVRVAVRGVGDDRPAYADAVVTCGSLPASDGGHLHDAVPPVPLPPEGDCVLLPPRTEAYEVALMGELSERIDPACMGWAAGQPSGTGELRGWVRFADDRPVDALSLLLFADCFPPATFDLGIAGWVPTMHLSVWLRAHPAAGPLRVRQVARVVDDGSASAGRSATVDEVCDVWDANGVLVATGHQLAGLLLPR